MNTITEQEKYNLASFFVNSDIELIFKFLRNFGGIKRYGDFHPNSIDLYELRKDAEKQKDNRIKLIPFTIKNRDLAICLELCVTPEGRYYLEYTYRNTDSSKEDTISLTAGKYASSHVASDILVHNGKIIYKQVKAKFFIDNDLTIIPKEDEIIRCFEFDIVKKQYSIHGTEVIPGVIEEKILKDFVENIILTDKWHYNNLEQKVDNEKTINPEFKEAFEALHLEALYKLQEGESMVALIYLCKMPEFETLFVRKNLLRCTVRQTLMHIQNNKLENRLDPNYYLTPSKTAAGLVGFGDENDHYINESHFNGFDGLDEIKKIQHRLSKAMPDMNGEHFGKFCDIFKHPYSSRDLVAYLMYLGQKGYKFSEIYQYTTETERKQAIQSVDAIRHLYRIVYYYELIHGKVKKLFPKSLKLMLDVTQRDLRLKFETSPQEILINHAQSRQCACSDESFRISTLADKERMLSEIRQNNDIFEYHSVKKKSPVYIRVHDNILKSISEKLSESHLENIKKWASLNNIYAEDIKVKRDGF